MNRPTDELVQRLLAAAAAGAEDRAAPLIDEARAEAEAEVKELLKTALKAVLLRRAVDHLEAGQRQAPAAAPIESSPPGPSDSTACYVYAITRSDWGYPPADLRGLDGRAPLRVVRYDDLQAIAGYVSLDEFGPGAIDERLKDLAWVEQKVRGHDAVVKLLSAAGTVIPCRFCTILPAEEDARAALARHHDAIHQTLNAIDGKREWGVKLVADTRSTTAAASPEEPEPTGDAGRAYLMQKKRRGRQREDVVRAAEAAAETCHRELSLLAADAALLPTRDRGGSRAWHLALNTAYLVPDADAESFQARVEALAQQYRPQGLRIDLTGPWPPYNFVALDLSEAVT